MSLLVTNIQRFSIHDGPGIRTTVFLKGCYLRCPWCCNPENIEIYPEFYFKSDDCLNKDKIICEECIKSCKLGLINQPGDILKIKDKSTLNNCFKCKKCVESCPKLALGIYGTKISTKDLVNLIEKDKEYYLSSKGGVTFSGGEPLLQYNGLYKCLKELKKKKINVAIETSLFAPLDALKTIEDLVDIFIIDIKIIEAKKCQELMKGKVENFEANVKEIFNKNKKFIFRFPLIKGFTLDIANIKLLYSFLIKYDINYLEVFNAHNLAYQKYQSLNLQFPEIEPLKKEEINAFKEKITKDLKIEVKIHKI